MRCIDMSRLRKAKVSLGWYFFLLGATVGNWSALIPTVLITHEINEAVLGGILVCAIAGATLAAPISTLCIKRYGSGFSTVCGSTLLVCLAIVIGIPGELWLLAVGLTLLGFGMGWTDVSVNSQAMLCEKFSGKSTIGFFHAVYAFGGLVGVLFGGCLVQLGVSALNIFILFVLITILPTILIKYGLFSKMEEKDIRYEEKLGNAGKDLNMESNFGDALLMDFENIHNDKINLETSNDVSHQNEEQIMDNMESKTDDKYGISKKWELISSCEGQTAETLSAKRTRVSNDTNIIGSHNPLASITEVKVDLVVLQSRDSTYDSESGNNTSGDDSNRPTLPSLCMDSSGQSTLISPPTTQLSVRKVDYRVILLLSSLGGLAYIGEGSIGDWSTVYLVIWLKSSPIIGVLGFAVFQLIVCIGRYSSDTIVEYVDRKLLLQISGCLACLGLGVVGLAQSLPDLYIVPCAITGFAICGLGLSVVAPIVIYLAGNTVKGLEPEQAIAYVTASSYLGVMAGPPLFGALSEALKGLRWSLLLDGALMLFILFLACFLPSRDSGKNNILDNDNLKSSIKIDDLSDMVTEQKDTSVLVVHGGR